MADGLDLTPPSLLRRVQLTAPQRIIDSATVRRFGQRAGAGLLSVVKGELLSAHTAQ